MYLRWSDCSELVAFSPAGGGEDSFSKSVVYHRADLRYSSGSEFVVLSLAGEGGAVALEVCGVPSRRIGCVFVGWRL